MMLWDANFGAFFLRLRRCLKSARRAVGRDFPGQLRFCGADVQRAAEHAAGRFARPSKTRKVGGSSAPRAQAKQLGGVGGSRFFDPHPYSLV